MAAVKAALTDLESASSSVLGSVCVTVDERVEVLVERWAEVLAVKWV